MSKTSINNGLKDNELSPDIDMGFGGGDFDSGSIAGFSDADFGDLGIEGAECTGVQLASLGVSFSDESAYGFGRELSDAESAIIRLAEGKITRKGGRVASAKSEKVYITHEDFDEGPERDAFLLIFGYAENLFEGPVKHAFNGKDIKKIKALKFFFCRSLGELSFVDAVACIHGEIRVDVLRLRFMLEFWLRGWKIPQFPEDAESLPSRIELAAAQYQSMIGVSIVREAWFEPGIDAAVLLDRVLEDRDEKVYNLIKSSFKDLVLNYILSIADGKVYTTGKNPILELEDKINDPSVSVRGGLANIYWSRRF
jgi:hypothetical protein